MGVSTTKKEKRLDPRVEALLRLMVEAQRQLRRVPPARWVLRASARRAAISASVLRPSSVCCGGTPERGLGQGSQCHQVCASTAKTNQRDVLTTVQ